MSDGSRLFLKRGNAFLVIDPTGDISGEEGSGLYLEDTRHLDRFALSLGDGRLHLAGMEIPSAYSVRIDLIEEGSEGRDPNIYIKREIVLSSHLLEVIHIHNLSGSPRVLNLALSLGADFKDIFEVRGIVESRRRAPSTRLREVDIQWMWRGVDRVSRWTRILFRPPPSTISKSSAVWNLSLGPKESTSIEARVDFGIGRTTAASNLESIQSVIKSVERDRSKELRRWAGLEVDNAQVAAWLGRSMNDAVDLLMTVDGHRVPAAGLPWYATLFGRDSLIFGLETVYLNPQLSMGILYSLAALQGREHDSHREEEPGKILHELRRGELAGSGQIPHTPYFGTVDATPLFLCLLSEVYLWTGNLGFCEELYRPAAAAAAHIQDRMESGVGSFLSYVGGRPPGQKHQGWKDSDMGVTHPDGSEPEPPIALCEVQGYAYWGLKGLAGIARALGDEERATGWEGSANDLRDGFDAAFWMPAKASYALALDGQGQQVKSQTSNPGHLLMCGILARERARRVARKLIDESFFTGWGVRTMSKSERQYHPLSYHNGSVWPHDTAVTAWGMSRCGFQEEASTLFEGLLDSARGFHFRLPELFGGFARGGEGRPVPIPQACDIQAWVAGAPFLMLRGLLGIEADAPSGRLSAKPFLPSETSYLRVASLRLGDTLLDMRVEGEGEKCEVEISRVEGPEIELCEEL